MGSSAISKLVAALAAAALSTTLFAGCATTSGSVDNAPSKGTNAQPAGDDSTKPTDEATDDSSSPSDDGTVAFGQSYKYEDGLQVTLSKPAKYKPSRWAIAKKSKNYLVLTVTVVNGTGKKFDPTLFHLSGQSGDEEADQVFDSQKNVGGSPNTKLLKGRQAKWKVAFAVKNPKDFVVEVSPGPFEYDPIMYQL